ncbi:nucleotidyltransferase domain-containing protein [Pricia sp. S334]|uniref:Nucleotidyltransferase domain-containing protein n=1 Tax=Pricia mediterranea TaxID=3076079 RepID=A0ABU3L1E9_9FLAO|nr:nucleotidyltransferase domain-containing protein [Pricia sp. S334]MDT7827556.1 nucleotidyltransferase domain-containing protein [Pricia sp. S334]
MEKKDNIIDSIVDIADRNHPDSEIFQYGSRAQGDEKVQSDWDLLILLDDNDITFEKEIQIMDDYYDLELETGEVFSPLSYAKKDWIDHYLFSPLYNAIEQVGIKLR